MILLLILGYVALCGGAPAPSRAFTHFVELSPGSQRCMLYWKYDNESITLEIHGQTLGYVGFGLSQSGGMEGADIAIGWVKNGEVMIKVCNRNEYCFTFAAENIETVNNLNK